PELCRSGSAVRDRSPETTINLVYAPDPCKDYGRRSAIFLFDHLSECCRGHVFSNYAACCPKQLIRLRQSVMEIAVPLIDYKTAQPGRPTESHTFILRHYACSGYSFLGLSFSKQ